MREVAFDGFTIYGIAEPLLAFDEVRDVLDIEDETVFDHHVAVWHLANMSYLELEVVYLIVVVVLEFVYVLKFGGNDRVGLNLESLIHIQLDGNIVIFVFNFVDLAHGLLLSYLVATVPQLLCSKRKAQVLVLR